MRRLPLQDAALGAGSGSFGGGDPAHWIRLHRRCLASFWTPWKKRMLSRSPVSPRAFTAWVQALPEGLSRKAVTSAICASGTLRA